MQPANVFHMPVLFLDIDGVLAPFDRRQPNMDTIRVGGWYGTLVVNPSVLTRIRDLHRANRIQVNWLTSWEHDANTMFAPATGLDTYPVHEENTALDPNPDWYWKEAVVRAHAATGHPFIWVDDEMTTYNSHHTVTADYPNTGLVIAPDSLTGLTHEHLDHVEAFIQELPQGRKAQQGIEVP